MPARTLVIGEGVRHSPTIGGSCTATSDGCLNHDALPARGMLISKSFKIFKIGLRLISNFEIH